MDRSPPFDDGHGDPIQLELISVSPKEFRLPKQFRYQSSRHDEPFLIPTQQVPADPHGHPKEFRTDLMSVPRIFGWFVPALGAHLPAVLLHDALVLGEDEPKRHDGPDVDRVEADRLFRDGLGDLRVPKIRRWVIWASVALATTWLTARPRARWWPTIVVTFAAIAALGTIATLDVVDVWDVLPWMDDGPWWREILLGGVAALVVPGVLALAWYDRHRLDRMGIALIIGVGLAFFLHVTAAILVVTGLYQLAEWIVSRREGNTGNVRKNLESPTAGAAQAPPVS